MAAPTGDGGGSPLSGCYLLLVLSEPHRADHRPLILQRVVKGLSSWNQQQCGVDLGQELQALIDANPEGEQFKFGERLIQFATENVVAEILVNPQVYTFQQCLKNMLASFTRHRHLIHAGYVFSGNGSWILQDGTFSGNDLLDALRETDVQRVNRAYESSLSVHIHCPEEGIWRSEALLKDPVFAASKVQMNPPDRDAAPPQVAAFREYLSGFLNPASLEDLLSPSDVVGNIRFSRPTLYVFPGGQGDAAMFGINGFNILFDGGFSRRACCWNFVRHLDRLDAVLMSRLHNGNLMGMSAMLQRKVDHATYPQMGHFFANLVDQKSSADVDKDADPLLVNTQLEAQRLLENLKALSLKPTPCLRENSGDPINLYHKVGHGRLDLYVLNPQKDANEMQAFLKSWTDGPDQSRVTLRVKGREFPVANLVSICCLLVWVPDDRHDTVTRLLFPGSTPQQKVFDGLDRLKHLDFMKTPVCYVKSLGVKKNKTLDTLLKSGPKAPPAGTRAERIERVEVEPKRRVRSTSRQTRNGDATDTVKRTDKGDKELLAEIKAKKQEANRERAERPPAAKPKPKPEKADAPKEPRPTAVSRPKKTKAAKDDNKQADDSSEGKNGSIASLPKDEKEATPVKAKKDVSNTMIVEEKKVSRTTTKAKQTKPETKTKAAESRAVSKVTETKATKTGETKKVSEKGKARQEPKAEKSTGARSRIKPPASPKHVRSIKPKGAQAIRPPATSTPKAKTSQEQEASTMRGTGDIEEVTMAGDMLTVTKVTTEVQRFIEEVQEGDSLEQMSGDFSREIETDSLELRKVDEKIDSLKQSPTTEDSKDLRQSSEEVLRRTDIDEAVLLRASSEQKSPPRPSEGQMKLEYLERASAQKKYAVKTPDEVAELPEHEALELPEHEVQHLTTTEPARSTDDIQRVMTTSHELPTEEDTEKEKESVAEEKLTSPKGAKDELNRRTKDSSPEEPQVEELPSTDAGGETRESLSQSPSYVEAGEISPKNSRQLDDIYTSPRREMYPIGEPYVESGVEAETRHETVQRERAEMVVLASSTTTPSPCSPSRDRWNADAPHLPSVDERSLEEAVPRDVSTASGATELSEAVPRDVSTASGATELSTVKIEDLYGDDDKVTPETQADVKDDDKKEDIDLAYIQTDDFKSSAAQLKEIEVTDKMVHETPDVYKKSEELAKQRDHVDDSVEDDRQRPAVEEIRSSSESKPQVSQDDNDKINAFLGEQASLVQEEIEHSKLVQAAHPAQDTSLTQGSYLGDLPANTEPMKSAVEEVRGSVKTMEPGTGFTQTSSLTVHSDKVASEELDKESKADDTKSQVTPADVSQIQDKTPSQETSTSASDEHLKTVSVPDKPDKVSQVVSDDSKGEESFQPVDAGKKPSPQEPRDSQNTRDDDSQLSAFLQEQVSLVQTKTEHSATTADESLEHAKPSNIPSDSRDKGTHEETLIASGADIRPSVHDSKDIQESETLGTDKHHAEGKPSPGEPVKEQKEFTIPEVCDEPPSLPKGLDQFSSPEIAVPERHSELETATTPDAQVSSHSADLKDLAKSKPTVADEKHLSFDTKVSESPQDHEDDISAFLKEQASLVQDQTKFTEHTAPTFPVHEKSSQRESDTSDVQEGGKSYEATDVAGKRSPDVLKSPKEPTDLLEHHLSEDTTKGSPSKYVQDIKPDARSEQAEPLAVSPIDGKFPVTEAVSETAECTETALKPSEKSSVLAKDLEEMEKLQEQKLDEKQAPSVSRTSPDLSHDDDPVATFLQEQASLIQAQSRDESKTQPETKATTEPTPPQPIEYASVKSMPVKSESETAKTYQDSSPMQKIDKSVIPADVETSVTSKLSDIIVGDAHIEAEAKPAEKSPTEAQDEKEKQPSEQTILSKEHQEEKGAASESTGQKVEETSISSDKLTLGSHQTDIIETVQTSTYTSLDSSLTSVSSMTKMEEQVDLDNEKREQKVSAFMTEQPGLVKAEPVEAAKEISKTPMSAAVDVTPSPEGITATSGKIISKDDGVDKALVDEDQASKLKLQKDFADDEAHTVQPSTLEAMADADVKASPKGKEDEAKHATEVSASSTPMASTSDDKDERPVPAKTEETPKVQSMTDLQGGVPDDDKPVEQVSLVPSAPVKDLRFDDKVHVDDVLSEQAELVKERHPDAPIHSEFSMDTHAPAIASQSEDSAHIDAFLAEQTDLIKDDKSGGEADLKVIRDDFADAAKVPELVEKEPVVALASQSKPAMQQIDSGKTEQETVEVKQFSTDVADPDHQMSTKPVTSDSKNEARETEQATVRAPVTSEKEEKTSAEHDVIGHVQVPLEKSAETKLSESPEDAFLKEQAALVVDKTKGKDGVKDEHAVQSSDFPVDESLDKEQETIVPTLDEDVHKSSLIVEEQLTTREPEKEFKRHEEETKVTDQTFYVQQPDGTADATVTTWQKSPEKAFETEQVEIVKDAAFMQEDVPRKQSKPDAGITTDESPFTKQTDETLHQTDKTSDSTVVGGPETPERAFPREQAELVKDKAAVQEDVFVKETKHELDSAVITRPESPEKIFLGEQAELVKDKAAVQESTPAKEIKPDAGYTIDETISTKQTEATHQKADQTSESTVTRPESPEKVFQRDQAGLTKDKTDIYEGMPTKETRPDAGITIDETTSAKQPDETSQKTDQTSESTVTIRPESPERAFLREQAELVKEKTLTHEDATGKETKQAADSTVTTRSESPEKAFLREQAELVKGKTSFQEVVTGKETKLDAGIAIDETIYTKQAEETLQKTDQTSGITVTTRSESPEKAFQRDQAGLTKDKTDIYEGMPSKETRPDAGITIDETTSAKQPDETAQETDQTSESTVTIRPDSPERAFLREQAELVKEKTFTQEDEPGKETKQAPDSTVTTRSESPEKAFLREQAELVKDKAAIQEGVPRKEAKLDAGIAIDETIYTKQAEETLQKTNQTSGSTVTTRSESPEKALQRDQAGLTKEKTDIHEGMPIKETRPDAGITIDEAIPTKQPDETAQKTDQTSESTVTIRPESPERAFLREQAELVKEKTLTHEDAPGKETKQAPDSTVTTRSESPEKAFLREQAELVKDKAAIQDGVTGNETKLDAGIAIDKTIYTKQAEETLQKTDQTSGSTVTTRSESPEKAFQQDQAGLTKDKTDIHEGMPSKETRSDAGITIDEAIPTKQPDETVQKTDQTSESTVTIGPESPERAFRREQAELVKEKAAVQEDVFVKETKQPLDSAVTARPESPEKAFLREQAELVKEKTTTQENVPGKETKPDADDAIHETTYKGQSRDTVSEQKVETYQSQLTLAACMSSSPTHQITAAVVESESSEMQQPASLTESTTSEVSVTSAPPKKTSYIIEEYEVISPRRRQQYEDVEEIVTYSPKKRSEQVSEVSVVSSTEDQSPRTSDQQVSVKKLSQETSSLMQNIAGISVEDSKPVSVDVRAEKVEMTSSGRPFRDVEEIQEEVVAVQTSQESYAEPTKRVHLEDASSAVTAHAIAGLDDLMSQIQAAEADADKPITDDIAGIEEQVMSVKKPFGSYAQPPLRAERISTVSATSERHDVDEDDLMSQILSGKDIATDIVISTKPKDTSNSNTDAGEPAAGGKTTTKSLAKEKAKLDQEDVEEETMSSSDDRMICGRDDVALPHKLTAHPEFDRNLSPSSAQAEIEDTLLQMGAGLVAKSSSYETLAAEAGKLDEKPVKAKASPKHAERDLDSLLSQIQTYEASMPILPDTREKKLSPSTDVPPAEIHQKPSEDLTSKLEGLGSDVDKIMKVKPCKIKDGDVCIGEDDGADYAIDAEGPITSKRIADLGPIAGKDDKASKDTPSVGGTEDKPQTDKPSDEDKHHAEAPKVMEEKKEGEAKAKSIPDKSPEKELQKVITDEATTSDKHKDASPTDDSWLDEQMSDVSEKTHPTSKHIAAYPATTVKSPRRKIIDSPDLSDEDLLTDAAKAKTDVCADSAKSSPEEKTTAVPKPDSTEDRAQSGDIKPVKSAADHKAATTPTDDDKTVTTPPENDKATSAPAKDTSPLEPQPIVVGDAARQVEQKGSARKETTAPLSGEMDWIKAEPPADKRPVSAPEDAASPTSEEAAVKSKVSVSKDPESESSEPTTAADPARSDDIDARTFKPSEVSSQLLKTEDSMNGNGMPCGDSEGAVVHELMDAAGILSAFVPGVAERFEDMHHDEHAVPAPSDATPGPTKQADAAPTGAVAGVASAEQSISPTAPSVERRNVGEGPGAALDVVDSAGGRDIGWVAEPVHEEETAQVVTVTDAARKVESKGTARRDSVGSSAGSLKMDSVDGASREDDVAAPGVIQITETSSVTQDVGGGKQGQLQVEKSDETELKDDISSELAAQGLQTKFDESSTGKIPASHPKEADMKSHESKFDQLSHLSHDEVEAVESQVEKVISSLSTTLSSLGENAGAGRGVTNQAPTVEETATAQLLDETVTSSGKYAEKTTEESTVSHVSHVVHDALVAAEEQAEKAASSMSTTLSSLIESTGAGLGWTTQTEVIEQPSTAVSLGEHDAAVPKAPAEATQQSTGSDLGHLAHDALLAVESEAEKAVSSISATISTLAKSTGLITHTDAADRSPEAPMKDEKTIEQPKETTNTTEESTPRETTKTTEESSVSHLGHGHDTIAAAKSEAEKASTTITTTLSSLAESAGVALGLSPHTSHSPTATTDLPGDKPSGIHTAADTGKQFDEHISESAREKSPTLDAHPAASRSQSVPALQSPVEARGVSRQTSEGVMLAGAAEPQGTTESSSSAIFHDLAGSVSDGKTATSETVEKQGSGVMGSVNAALAAGAETVLEDAETAMEAAQKSSTKVSDQAKQQLKEVEKAVEETTGSVKEGAAHTVTSVSQYIAQASAKIEDFMSGRSKPESAVELVDEPTADTTKTDTAKTEDLPGVTARFMDKSESIFQTNEKSVSGDRTEEKMSKPQSQLQTLSQDVREATADVRQTVEETVSSVCGYVTGETTAPDTTQSTTDKDQTAMDQITSAGSKSPDTKAVEPTSDASPGIAPKSTTEAPGKDIHDSSGIFASITSTIVPALQSAGQILSGTVPTAAEQLEKQIVHEESADEPATIPAEKSIVAPTEQKHQQDEESAQSLTSPVLDAISTEVSAVVDTTSITAERVKDSLLKTSSKAADGAERSTDDAGRSTQQAMEDAGKSVERTIEDTGNDVKEKVKEAREAINKSADDLRKAIETESVQQLAKDLMEETADAIKTAGEMVGRVTSAAQEKAADADATLVAFRESTETAIQSGKESLTLGVQEVTADAEVTAETGKQLIRDEASSVADKGASCLSSADQAVEQASATIASATDSAKDTVLDSTKDLKQQVETSTQSAEDLRKDGTRETSQQILSTAKSADETFRGELKDLSEKIDDVIDTTKGVISGETKSFKEDIKSASKTAEDSLSSTMASAKADIAAAVTDTEKTVGDAHQKAKKEIEETIETVQATITGKMDDTKSQVEKVEEMSQEPLKTAAEGTEKQTEKASSSLSGPIVGGIQAVQDKGNAVTTSIKEDIICGSEDIKDKARSTDESAEQVITKSVQDVHDAVQAGTKASKEALSGAFENAPDSVESAGKAAGEGLATGVTQTKAYLDSVSDAAEQTLTSGAQDTKTLATDATKSMEDAAAASIHTTKTSIESASDQVTSDAIKAEATLATAAKDARDKAEAVQQSSEEALKNVVQYVEKQAEATAVSSKDALSDVAVKIGDQATSTGKTVEESFVSHLKETEGHIDEATAALGQYTASGVQDIKDHAAALSKSTDEFVSAGAQDVKPQAESLVSDAKDSKAQASQATKDAVEGLVKEAGDAKNQAMSSLGTAADVLKTSSESASDKMKSDVEEVCKDAAADIQQAKDSTEAVIRAAQDSLSSRMQEISARAEAVSKSSENVLSSAVEGAVDKVKSAEKAADAALTTATQQAQDQVDAVTTAIDQTVTGGVDSVKKQSATVAASDAFTTGVAAAQTYITDVAQDVKDLKFNVEESSSAAVEDVGNKAVEAKTQAEEAMATASEVITSTAVGAASQIKAVAQEADQAISSEVQDAKKEMEIIAQDIGGAVQVGVSKAAKETEQVGKALTTGVQEASQQLKTTGEVVDEACSKAVADAERQAQNVASSAIETGRDTAQQAQETAGRLQEGATEALSTADDQLSSAVREAKHTVNIGIEKLGQLSQEADSQLSQAAQGAAKTADDSVRTATETLSQLQRQTSDAMHDAEDVAKKAGGSVAAGVESVVQEVSSELSEAERGLEEGAEQAAAEAAEMAESVYQSAEETLEEANSSVRSTFGGLFGFGRRKSKDTKELKDSKEPETKDVKESPKAEKKTGGGFFSKMFGRRSPEEPPRSPEEPPKLPAEDPKTEDAERPSPPVLRREEVVEELVVRRDIHAPREEDRRSSSELSDIREEASGSSSTREPSSPRAPSSFEVVPAGAEGGDPLRRTRAALDPMTSSLHESFHDVMTGSFHEALQDGEEALGLPGVDFRQPRSPPQSLSPSVNLQDGEPDQPVPGWGPPLGLPSPVPPPDHGGVQTPPPTKRAIMSRARASDSPRGGKLAGPPPVYLDLVYVPHHANSFYSGVQFFHRVRARYYVFSSIEPSREVFNALLEAKQQWEDKDLEVTIIPTYDTDTLGHWFASNEQQLEDLRIDLAPSASRCTINLQDHETSCAAYRLEF